MAAPLSATRWIPLMLAAVWLAGCGSDPATSPGTEPAPAAVSPTDGQAATSPGPGATSSPEATAATTTGPAPRVPPASPRADGGGLNAGTPLRIPLPQDRLTSLKLPEAVARLEERIATACGGEACVSVLVQATQEDPPVPGQSCDDVQGVVGMTEDELGAPYFEAVVGGTVTLLTNIRCADVPSEDPSPTDVPTWEPPATGESAETSTPPDGGTAGGSSAGGSAGASEAGDPVPDESPVSTP